MIKHLISTIREMKKLRRGYLITREQRILLFSMIWSLPTYICSLIILRLLMMPVALLGRTLFELSICSRNNHPSDSCSWREKSRRLKHNKNRNPVRPGTEPGSYIPRRPQVACYYAHLSASLIFSSCAEASMYPSSHDLSSFSLLDSNVVIPSGLEGAMTMAFPAFSSSNSRRRSSL